MRWKPPAELPISEVEGVVRSLSLAIHSDNHIVLPLLQLKAFDQYTTTHATNVSVLAMALAEFIGLGARDVREYGIAGLLHDLGKVRIPKEILTKPGLTPSKRWPSCGATPRTGHASFSSGSAGWTSPRWWPTSTTSC